MQGAHLRGVFFVCISMHTGLSVRGKIDRASDRGDLYTQGPVRVCGGGSVIMRSQQDHSKGTWKNLALQFHGTSAPKLS